MGTDVADVVDELPYHYSFKVHRSLCVELLKLVDKISRVFPEIEAARPRCSSGIQALCLLNGTIDKSKQILRYCCESSKLYLVFTGDLIVSRCQRLRNNLERSLGQIQTMVPTTLAAEICRIIDDANATTITLDPSDEEAGKAMRGLILIQQGTSASDSVEYSEMKALQVAASRLHITSPKAILIEKRSVKKLLGKVGDNDPPKKNILKYLLYLLNEYGNFILEEQTVNPTALHEGLDAPVDSSNSSVNSLSVKVGTNIGLPQDEAQTDILSRGVPPEEFKCPISMRLMYDPVIIASGQTFERIWIQKWFNEGNDTCPKTKVKLAHRALIPNTGMKDLISKWCKKYEVTISDPSLKNYASFNISSTSMASLGISMNDLHLPVDVSSISIGSLDSSYTSDSSLIKVAGRSSLMSTEKTDDCHRFQPSAHVHETDSEFLTGLSKLNWDSQCKRVDKVKSELQCSDQASYFMSSDNFIEPLFRFLRDAHDQHDVTAQRAGYQLLLAFVSRNRSGISYLHEDAFSLLVSFLNSEVIEEGLAILELSSSEPCCRSKIAASGALVPILHILDSKTQSKGCQDLAVKILHNLSSNSDICTQIVYLGFIPKLVPFIKDGSIARHCIVLLKNLCVSEEAKIAVAETNGCIASIAELLECGGREEQEHGVSILLSLCTQYVQYCQMVMDEGIIPALVDISVNGNDKGKASALELLRHLRDIEFSNEEESHGSEVVDVSRDAGQEGVKEKKASRTSGFFKMNLSLFSKPKKKR
ncbi:U-box domain-containing protein 5 [Euphorbia lathyris]|uniref:U-box domain-containing protein 5 n=1 Tax=Euphorbia lathyris TaxID=212925 RepID=UPI003313CD7E